MKTKEKKPVLKQLRQIRDKISLDIQDMNFQEIKEYLENKNSLRSGLFKKQADQ